LQHRPQQLITHLEFVIENYLEMAKEAWQPLNKGYLIPCSQSKPNTGKFK
jgi:hypothetical protein